MLFGIDLLLPSRVESDKTAPKPANLAPFAMPTRLLPSLALLVTLAVAAPASAQSTDARLDPLQISANGIIDAVVVQSDERILIGGRFTTISSQTRRRLARLEADGTLDPSFAPNINGNVRAVALQSDGRILVGGDFTTVNGVARNGLARLEATGSLDTTFNPQARPNTRVITVQPDGNILVGGLQSFARLQPSGANDTSFSHPLSDNQVFTVTLLPGGSMLVGGAFNSPRPGLVQLSANGSINNAFAPVVNGPVRSIAVQGDGRILIAGGFTIVNDDPWPYVARLESTGQTDSTFIPLAGSTQLDVTEVDDLGPFQDAGMLYSVCLLPDASIMLGGNVKLIGDTGSRSRLARVRSNGSIISTFTLEPNQEVRSISLTPSGRMIISGNFTSLGSVARNRLMRFHFGPALASVSVNPASATVAETAASVAFDVTLSAPLPVPVSVPLAFSGSATSGRDYTRPATSVRFDIGETLKTVTLPVLDDDLIEGNETIVVTLGTPPDPALSRLAPFTFTATLTSDDVAPQITLQPLGATVRTGAPLLLEAAASGTPAPRLQWRKGTSNIPGATNSQLSVPAVTLADAGRYSFRATVGVTTAVSSSVAVTVVDSTPGFIPAPTTGTATLVARFSSPETPTFRWLRDGNPVSDVPGRISGSRSSRLVFRQLELGDADDYVCEVTTPTGTATTDDITLLVYDSAPEIVADPSGLTLPQAMVSEAYQYSPPINTDPLKTPTSFVITGLPPGLNFDRTTGRISGRPTRSGTFDTIRITAVNAKGRTLPVPATLVVLPLPSELVGSFIGTIERDPDVNAGLGGSFAFSVASTGMASGSLRLGGSTWNFRGPLDTAATGGSTTATFTVARGRTLLPAVLSLTFSISSPNALVSGDVSIAGFAGEPDADGHLCLPASITRQGYHTSALELASLDDRNNDALPQGASFMSLTVVPSGTVRISGHLGDGTPVSASTRIGPSGELPLYLPLYRNTGSLLATLEIAADASHTVSGDGDWLRKAQAPSQRSYQAGFGPIDLTAKGGLYLPPLSLADLINAVSPNPQGLLRFNQGGIAAAIAPAAAPLNLTVNLSTYPGSVATPLVPGAALTRSTFKAVRNTGLIQGSLGFSNVVGTKTLRRTANYLGMVVRDGAAHQATGYFLLPQLPALPTDPANATPILSGQVTLTAPPP